nr:HepT-like ribonuclease domain-containing protein [Dictyoglomus sp.]
MMVGFRDKLIHFYFGIKYEIVWETIKSKIPELIEDLGN